MQNHILFVRGVNNGWLKGLAFKRAVFKGEKCSNSVTSFAKDKNFLFGSFADKIPLLKVEN